jgi:hypothetical protein
MTAPPTTTYPATPAGLIAALAALGKDADAVAAALDRAGIRGHRGGNRTCPIAAYLNAALTGCPHVRVDTDRAHLGLVSVALPRAVVEFVRRFDLGKFAALTPPEPGQGLSTR